METRNMWRILIPVLSAAIIFVAIVVTFIFGDKPDGPVFPQWFFWMLGVLVLTAFFSPIFVVQGRKKERLIRIKQTDWLSICDTAKKLKIEIAELRNINENLHASWLREKNVEHLKQISGELNLFRNTDAISVERSFLEALQHGRDEVNLNLRDIKDREVLSLQLEYLEVERCFLEALKHGYEELNLNIRNIRDRKDLLTQLEYLKRTRSSELSDIRDDLNRLISYKRNEEYSYQSKWISAVNKSIALLNQQLLNAVELINKKMRG